jgi:hypothetical protein
MRFAHFPQHLQNTLRGEAARTSVMKEGNYQNQIAPKKSRTRVAFALFYG